MKWLNENFKVAILALVVVALALAAWAFIAWQKEVHRANSQREVQDLLRSYSH